jgi:hypothetical protein
MHPSLCRFGRYSQAIALQIRYPEATLLFDKRAFRLTNAAQLTDELLLLTSTSTAVPR